jgi:hypothetical protein
MGIYTNGILFGIKMYKYDINDDIKSLYEVVYDTKMTNEQKKEAYLFYDELSNKENIKFQIFQI